MSYDQGQASIGMWNMLEDGNTPTLPRNEIATFRKIHTPVDYDAGSQLQIEFSSTTHIPQGCIVPDSPLRLTLDEKFITYDPFLWRSTANEQIDSMETISDFLFPMFNDMNNNLNNANLVLWSRNRSAQEVVRSSPQYATFTVIEYKWPATASQREQVWVLCAETLRNFDPKSFRDYDGMIETQYNKNRINIDDIRNFMISKMQVKDNYYLRFIKNSEIYLNTVSNQAVSQLQVISQNIINYVRNPNNHIELLSNPLNILVLWLTAPHVGVVGLSDTDMDYCMFVLAIAVLYKRIPTYEEWNKRIQQGGTFSNDPSFGESSTLGTAGQVSGQIIKVTGELLQRLKIFLDVLKNLGVTVPDTLYNIVLTGDMIVSTAQASMDAAQALYSIVLENYQLASSYSTQLYTYFTGEGYQSVPREVFFHP